MSQQETTNGARALAGVIGAAALALFSALSQYAANDQISTRFHDPFRVIVRQENLAPILPEIPRNAHMGYFTNDPNDESAQGDYFGTQYAIAPRMLAGPESKVKPEWWIGNFKKPADFVAAGQQRGLTMVRNLGNGIILYRLSSLEAK